MATQKKSRIEELLAQAESTSHEALKNAIEQHAAEEKLKEEKELLVQFKAASDLLDQTVRTLKVVRRREVKAKSNVIAIDKALTQFKTDGDYVVFTKTANDTFNW